MPPRRHFPPPQLLKEGREEKESGLRHFSSHFSFYPACFPLNPKTPKKIFGVCSASRGLLRHPQNPKNLRFLGFCGVPWGSSVQDCKATEGAPITFLPVPEVKSTARPINKSLLPAKPATTGLQGNPVVLLLYRKPQKSEIFGAASQDGGLLLTGGKGLFKGLLLTGGKGPLALRERRSTASLPAKPGGRPVLRSRPPYIGPPIFCFFFFLYYLILKKRGGLKTRRKGERAPPSCVNFLFL